MTRPVFIVGPPRSGAPLLHRALASSGGVWGFEGALEGIEELHPAQRDWASNRLSAEDASEAVLEALYARLREELEMIEEAEAEEEGRPRLLEQAPKNALRVSFLNAAFPDASFVYVYREPRKALASMLQGWESGQFVTYRELPDWPGPPWSFLLTPGWRELKGKPLAEVVAGQWIATTRILLQDLEQLAPERWCIASYSALSSHPQREIGRIAGFLGLSWDGELPPDLQALRQALKPPQRRRMKSHARALDAVLPGTSQLAARAREWLAQPAGSQDRPAAPPATESPLRSVYTQSIPALLAQLGSSLLVSTYQTGKLICARQQEGRLNTHFRDFERPMGLAVRSDRIAIGTRAEVLDYRNVPDAAAKVEPAGTHDACFVPRNRHYTGDLSIHEIAYAQGELWIVATNFSCLATLDAEHSFIPRWRPPFVSALAPEDRCHLNGLAVIDDRVRFVTALGQTDSAGGWRQNKASGGCLIDVESGETVLEGLCMPHSPRWHQGRLWLLESGEGAFCAVDLDSGKIETVAQLPGFTRGLAFAGPLAFVGLSQIRETATFGGLPLTKRLDQRLCGVWVINIQSGAVMGFLRFEDLVQEVFDVSLIPGLSFPEIAEPTSNSASYSYVLPDEALSDVAPMA